jgi:hypothetical protein
MNLSLIRFQAAVVNALLAGVPHERIVELLRVEVANTESIQDLVSDDMQFYLYENRFLYSYSSGRKVGEWKWAPVEGVNPTEVPMENAAEG